MPVDCFCNFIEISPPMSIHNLSHFKCPVMGEGMQNQTNGVLQGVDPSSHLGFPIALTTLLFPPGVLRVFIKNMLFKVTTYESTFSIF